MTALASGRSSAAALLNPVNPSIATISMRSRHMSGREASQILKTRLERPGTSSNNRAVGCSFPRVRSAMPVISRVPRRRRSWWCHTPLIAPGYTNPCETGRVIRCGLIWDHTVFHVVPHWRARPKIVAPSKRNCRIVQRIARTPKRARGAHTEWFCSMKVAIWQVVSRHIQRRLCHRIRTGTPAQGGGCQSVCVRGLIYKYAANLSG